MPNKPSTQAPVTSTTKQENSAELTFTIRSLIRSEPASSNEPEITFRSIL